MPRFSRREYKDRIKKTCDAMASRNIDILVVTAPRKINWLTGYDAWSFYVHQAVILSSEREEPLWIGREMDSYGALNSTWLKSKNILSYDDDYVQSSHKHPMSYMAKQIERLGAADGTIGIEKDWYYFTAKPYEVLLTELPNANFADTTHLVNRLMGVKSDKEIEYMQQAARLSEMGWEAVRDTIGEGVRQSEVVANLYQALLRGTDEFGGAYPTSVPHVNDVHESWTDETYEEGDIVGMEFGGCRYRYNAPLSRTVYIGTPTTEVVENFNLARDGLEILLDLIEPGKTIDSIMQEYRKRAPIQKAARLGYPVGVGYPPSWVNGYASFRVGDTTILEPDMTFHLVPLVGFGDAPESVYPWEYRIKLSETIRITSDGCEPLSEFPRELIVIE
jgi:Xaa-Pro aminopeptidase